MMLTLVHSTGFKLLVITMHWVVCLRYIRYPKQAKLAGCEHAHFLQCVNKNYYECILL